MRAVLIALPVALVLLAASRGAAQPRQSYQDLALRVNLDDQVRVEDRSGARVTGRLTRLTPDQIAIQTDAGEKRFASDTVRGVAVRGYALRKGALIGAGVGAVLGAVATCAHEGGGACVAIGLFGAAPIGAGVGLAIGALIPQMKPVYRMSEDAASVAPPSHTIGAPAGWLQDLALRVDLDEQLRVDDRSGGRTTGRLTRLTADEITILTPAGEKRFAREAVREVAVRRQPLRKAVLIGAGVGVGAGVAASCTGPSHEECADASIAAGALGAGVGLAVGALVRRTTVVYPEPELRTCVMPVIARGAVGVRASLRW